MTRFTSRRLLLWLALTATLLFTAFMDYHFLLGYPPGLDSDAAAYGLNALKPLRYGVLPFYDISNGAAEPLFIYSASVAIAIFGPTKLALRFLSASFGMAGIAMLYRFICEAGRGEFTLLARRSIALLAMAGLTVSQPVAFLYHMGMRFSTANLFQLAAAWGLLYALRLRRWSVWLAAGVLAALTQYTYLSNRTVPLLLLLMLILKLPQRWWRDKTLWQGLFVMGLTAGVLLLPQFIWYGTYPSTFLSRAGQVGLTANPLYNKLGLVGTVLDKFYKYWEALGNVWYGQYNQIKEPLLAPLFYYGFILSLPVGLISFRRRLPWLLLVGLAVMLLPDLLAGDRDWPHELRSIGAYAYAAALSGLGLGGVLAWLNPWPTVRRLAGAGLAVAVIVTAFAQANEFFSMDANLGKMYWGGNTWLRRVDASIGELIARDPRPYLLPLENFADTPVKFLSANRALHIRSALTSDGSLLPGLLNEANIRILLPRQDGEELWAGDPTQWVLYEGDTVYVLPPLTAAEMLPLLPSQADTNTFFGQGMDTPVHIGSWADVLPNQVPLPQRYTPSLSLDVCFQSGVCLTGAGFSDEKLQPGGEIQVHLDWQTKRPIKEDEIMFMHLLDGQGNALTGLDEYPLDHAYRTYEWHTDETIVTTSTLKIPANLQPGAYTLEVGFYLPYDISRIKTVDANGQATGDRILIPNLEVARPVVAIPSTATQTQIVFGDELALSGYRVESLPTDSQPLRLSLWWQALKPASQNWTVFFHLTPLTDNTTLLGQVDRELTGGTYPPEIWGKGEIVEDQVELQAPGLTAGKYALWFGLYNPDTFERLPILSSPNPIQDNRTRLLEITVP